MVTMIDRSEVADLEQEIDSLKEELSRVETTHRQLLLRYVNLKNIVDEAFKRFEQEQENKGDLSMDLGENYLISTTGPTLTLSIARAVLANHRSRRDPAEFARDVEPRRSERSEQKQITFQETLREFREDQRPGREGDVFDREERESESDHRVLP